MENDLGTHPDLNKSLSDLKCSSCQDGAPATSWCVECAEFICDDCVQVKLLSLRLFPIILFFKIEVILWINFLLSEF